MATIFLIKFKTSKNPPYVVDNNYIQLIFLFHENLANGFGTIRVLNKNGLTINTINLIDPGRKTKINYKICFFHIQIFDVESLRSIATRILSLQCNTVAAVEDVTWYAHQSNTSRQIFNSGQEIIKI